MKPTYLFPLVLCLLLNMAVAETTVSVTAASQAATPTISTQDLKTLELQFQEKMLDLRKETLDSQQETIAWWLTLIGLLSLILPLAFYWRERSNMLENLKQAINEAKGHTDQAEKYLSEIKSQHRTAADYTAQIQQMRDYQSNSDNAAAQQAAVQVANDLQDNEQIPLAERLRAHAIVLSDQAKSYAEHEQAFYAWQAVIQHSPNDADALFNAAYQAREAYKQGNRVQQSAWFPHIEQGYQRSLGLNPNDSIAKNNLGCALDDEAQALAQNNRFDEAWDKWDEAYTQYGEALRIKPDFYLAADNCINSLIHTYHARKQNQQDQAAQAKLAEAQTLAEDFIQNYPQHAAYLAYNLACVYTLLGSSTDKAMEQLRLAATSADNFPSKIHIEQDKDLDSIRQSPAFQDWFKHTFPN